MPGPTPGFQNRLFAVEAIASDDVWAAGRFVDAEGSHSFKLHWDGPSWTQVPDPGGSLALKGFTSDDVLAGGGGIFEWDGAAWTQTESFPEVTFPSVSGLAGPDPCDVWAVGRQLGEDGFLPFATRTDEGLFLDLGFQLEGDVAPKLEGSGSLAADASFALELEGMPPGVTGFLVFGSERVDLDLLGGVLVPLPETVMPLPTGGGSATLPFSFTPGVPPEASVFSAAWFPDAGGPEGFSATNALELVTP